MGRLLAIHRLVVMAVVMALLATVGAAGLEATSMQAAEAQDVDPQSADPQDVDSQDVDTQDVDPRAVDPQVAEAQEVDPQAVDPQEVDPQAVTRSFGSQPLDDVIAAANANTVNRPGCPLTGARLAAMMLAPVYSETGAITSRSHTPGPMTLSRWDTQSALYAFGNSSTQFRRAFWHPGVGMWQFDSAGFWNLTTAQAISSDNSANMAAKVLADRFCSSSAATILDRMRFAWAPWYACATGASKCIEVFNELFVNNTFANVVRDPSVGRLGGMVARTCRIGGVTQLPCHRVDPGAAQGYAAWAIAGFGPTPVTAPFYNYVIGDIEYRYWTATDTGYSASVIASKRITANARTGLTWQTATATTAMCDVNAGIGDCGAPRVASTPWGNFSGDPFGRLDAASAGANALTVSGWAIDPDTNDPIAVHVYVDGAFRGAVSASASRPDVGAAVPGYGNNHGFSLRVGNLAPGDRRVCAYAINVGPWGSANTELQVCRTVRVSASPVGSFDIARLAPGGARVTGWAADPDSSATVQLEFTVDGALASTGSASLTRTDVAAIFPSFGSLRGFNTIVPLPVTPGPRRVCANAVDLPTADRVQLGCGTVVVPSGNPLGSVDAASPVTDGIVVAGWALDWTTANPVDVTVVVDGVAMTTVVASLSRPDVKAAYPEFDDRRGFTATVPAVRGPHTVCAVARGRIMACRSVTVTDGDFADVPPGSFAAAPSRWMADTGITQGFPTDWQFSPGTGLSRAQAALFLWRLMGSPSSATSCGWSDVPAGSGAAQAACWARGAGVITGVRGDPSLFDPTGRVTRAQMVGMLWRVAGQPAVDGPSRFVDVNVAAWFADAAAWADVHGISTGVAGTDRFDPTGPVTRGQMAALLWRLAGTDPAWVVTRPASAVR